MRDFPNQADRIRVEQRINTILRFGKAVVQGDVQAVKFAHQDPIGASKAVGQGSVGYLEFTLRNPDVGDFVNQVTGGSIPALLAGTALFTLAQNAEMGRALLV